MAIRGAKKKEEKPLYRTVYWWFRFPDDMLALIMERVMPYLAKLWNLALAEYVALDDKIRERLEREVHPLIKAAKEDDKRNGHGDLWIPKNKKVTKEQWMEKGKPKYRVMRLWKLKGIIARIYAEEVFKYFGYDELMARAKKQAAQAGHGALWDEENYRKKKEELVEQGFSEELVEEFVKFRSLRYDKELMLKHQINSLTGLRAQNPHYENIRRTCEEEILKTLFGAWISFMMLRAADDKDVRRPGERQEAGFFHAIPNRTAFSRKKKCCGKGCLTVNLGKDVPPLVLPVPNWNKAKKDGSRFYHRQMLEMASNFRQVTISRRAKNSGKSEPDLSKPGRFKISISFDIPKPPEVPCTEKNTVYLAIGGFSIGVKSATGEEVIHIAVPDKFHRGFDENGKPKGIDALDEKIAQCQEGSRRQKQRSIARQKRFAKMARQKEHNSHETICHKLLRQGIHFVATNLVIRSKPGKLADASKPERSGALGPNYIAQNTGIAFLIRKLSDKAQMFGGKVKLEPPPSLTLKERRATDINPSLPRKERERRLDLRKIFLARNLQKEFLAKETKK